MFKVTGKDVFHPGASLNAVVKNDDGTIVCVGDRMLKAFVRRHPLVEIHTQHAPHNNPVILVKHSGHQWRDLPVWRPE